MIALATCGRPAALSPVIAMAAAPALPSQAAA
jgi:hypothetical protein